MSEKLHFANFRDNAGPNLQLIYIIGKKIRLSKYGDKIVITLANFTEKNGFFRERKFGVEQNWIFTTLNVENMYQAI